jgi:hypothetical protein
VKRAAAGADIKKDTQCEIFHILWRRRFLSWLGQSRPSGGIIMKTMLAALAVASMALMSTGANAYRSNAQGNQAYPNPDRETYVNRSCCSWKTNHKAPHKVVK